jgi:hypothetical protein
MNKHFKSRTPQLVTTANRWHEKAAARVLFILLLSLILLSAFSIPALAASNPDTDQFISYHSTAFGTEYYQEDYVQSLIEAEDGSIIMAGYTAPRYNNAYAQHAILSKYNKDGTIAWECTYGGGADGQGTTPTNANYHFYRVIQLSNGDFLAIGDTNEALGLSADGYLNFFVARIDNDGNTLWQKAYGITETEASISGLGARENDDGSISIWGKYQLPALYPVQIELIINGSGDLQTSTVITDDTYGNTINSTENAMEATPDGGYLAWQCTWQSGRWTDTLVKLDSDKQMEWNLTLIPEESSTLYDNSKINSSRIIVLDDGYLIAGKTTIITSEGSTTGAAIVYRLDLDGNVLWTKTYTNMTLNNNISSIYASLAPDGDVLLSVTNGYSSVDFTVFNISSDDGSVEWAKAYGTTTSFDRGYGGSTPFTLIENTDGMIVGVGDTFITKFAGDGSIAFDYDYFIYQERNDYQIMNIEATAYSGYGFMVTMETNVSAGSVSRLTGQMAYDTDYFGENASLTSIEITSPATKLTYQVGATLDLSGLVVTGTYSDGTTQTETVTAENITGFDSSAAASNQVLTITIGDQTTTYLVQIVAAGEPGQGELTGFLGMDPSGNYYLYNKQDFNNAYLAYQINPNLASTKMYQHFLNNECQIVALKDATRGYMDYQAAATASLIAQIKGQTFDINTYFASGSAALYTKTVSYIWIVNTDGSISF